MCVYVCVRACVRACKVHLRTGHEGPKGEQRYSSTLSWTSALDLGRVVNATTRLLYPLERPGTHCIGGWVGLRAGLVGCGKVSSPTRIRSPDRPARCELLYRLRFPVPHVCIWIHSAGFSFLLWAGRLLWSRMTTSYLEPLASDETPRSLWAQNAPGCFQPTEKLRAETCAES